METKSEEIEVIINVLEEISIMGKLENLVSYRLDWLK